MQLGVVFPQTEIGNDPAAIRDYAQAAEGAGYEHLLAFDHVLGADPDRPGGFRGPYNHETPFHEPFVLFGYLAGVTQLELTTGILILPQRQTVLVAKQASQLHVLTDGRLRLGVGIGWNAVEYEGLNQNFRNRGRRIEEQIALMRALWSEPVISFEAAGTTSSRPASTRSRPVVPSRSGWAAWRSRCWSVRAGWPTAGSRNIATRPTSPRVSSASTRPRAPPVATPRRSASSAASASPTPRSRRWSAHASSSRRAPHTSR